MGVVLSVVLALFATLLWCGRHVDNVGERVEGGSVANVGERVEEGDVCGVVHGGGGVFVVRFIFCVVALLYYGCVYGFYVIPRCGADIRIIFILKLN